MKYFKYCIKDLWGPAMPAGQIFFVRGPMLGAPASPEPLAPAGPETKEHAT